MDRNERWITKVLIRRRVGRNTSRSFGFIVNNRKRRNAFTIAALISKQTLVNMDERVTIKYARTDERSGLDLSRDVEITTFVTRRTRFPASSSTSSMLERRVDWQSKTDSLRRQRPIENKARQSPFSPFLFLLLLLCLPRCNLSLLFNSSKKAIEIAFEPIDFRCLTIGYSASPFIF